jgi:predicted PurR-regulated permease PerM
MKSQNSPNRLDVEDKAFLLLLLGVSLAFALILWPFFGAVFWGVILAVLFTPLYQRLAKAMRQKRTLAALATLTIILVMVILPLGLIVLSLVEEASRTYQRMESGELNFGQYFRQVFDALPAWATHLLDNLGLTNLGALQERLSAGLKKGSQVLVAQAINIGQNTVNFVISLCVMLYLLFFFLRDGDTLSKRVKDAVPLGAEEKRALFEKFTVVVRATVKGNILVALLQGALGGLIFWILGIHAALLWAVLMAVLSLLPAVGAALVWLPVGIYFLATGAVGKGVVLILYGVLVISLVDNFVRPFLVGKDIRMPDYVVLISTLGGIAIFGVNGFVLGPLIAAMFMVVWDIFSTTKAHRASLRTTEVKSP